jgi:diphthine-ammonia ligase
VAHACAELQRANAAWGDVVYVTLVLRRMEHFAAANRAYRESVPQASAPARACICAPLPAAALCALDAAVARGARSFRKVLHVQSHSEWAPASIGPYSQAVVWCGLGHLAGQIPLDPATMQVRSTRPRACVCAHPRLMHARRICR